MYVNRGAGVFIGNRQAARILIDWRTTRNVYTIAGQGTGRAGANTNLYMDASGRYPLGEQTFNFPPPGSAFNKTKYQQWKDSLASLPPKRELGEKRKLVQTSHLPLFRKLQEEDANQNKNAGACLPGLTAMPCTSTGLHVVSHGPPLHTTQQHYQTSSSPAPS